MACEVTQQECTGSTQQCWYLVAVPMLLGPALQLADIYMPGCCEEPMYMHLPMMKIIAEFSQILSLYHGPFFFPSHVR